MSKQEFLIKMLLDYQDADIIINGLKQAIEFECLSNDPNVPHPYPNGGPWDYAEIEQKSCTQLDYATKLATILEWLLENAWNLSEHELFMAAEDHYVNILKGEYT